MKRILIAVLLSLCFIGIKAQQSTVSDSAVISLITCSPGEEIYSKFGHSAIRIKDVKSGTDLIFNYGIFSFDTNNFYLKFMKGETDYQLGVYDATFFFPEYAARNSMVSEQILNLSVSEKRILINSLFLNYEPQNRTYRYNFAFDNCATRPRDKIMAALNGYIVFQKNLDAKTFRQWVGYYVGTDTWLKFGIDLIFGQTADQPASISESTFLPEILMSEFQTAQIRTPNGINRNLVNQRTTLVEKNYLKEKEELFIFKPIIISLSLLIIGIIITIWDRRKRRHNITFDSALFLLSGIGGVVVAYMMFFSFHPLVTKNLNILWLNPLNLLVAVFVWIRAFRVGLFFYQFINMVFLITALFAFTLSVQDLNIAAFPLIVLLLIRSANWFALSKRRIFKHRHLK